MSKTLFIVNPNAGSGRGRKTWRKLEPQLSDIATDYSVVMTRHEEDIEELITQSASHGTERLISIGGDGTTNVVINALMAFLDKHPDIEMIYGAIPAGTGRDFARGMKLPLDTMEAANYILKQASVRTLDLGRVTYNNTQRYFLNISSAGISNDVVQRVERSNKYPWTFFLSAISALAFYKPEAMRIELDGEVWYEGKIYIAAVANGTTFGQGLFVAPDAKPDDGLFDVVIAEEMSTLALIRAFLTLYSGTHITNPKVKIAQAKDVRIMSSSNTSIGMDFDGEAAISATAIHYEILPKAIKILI